MFQSLATRPATPLPLGPSTYLGPAPVVQFANERALLAFPDQQIWATLAMPIAYQLTAGDIALVIGQDDAFYVIGVLKSSGDTVIRVAGNLKFEAQGAIELKSAHSITLLSTGVRVIADRIDQVARAMTEKFQTAGRWVKDLMTVRAGSIHTQTKGAHRVQAQRIVSRAEGDVHIDGNKIHLG